MYWKLSTKVTFAGTNSRHPTFVVDYLGRRISGQTKTCLVRLFGAPQIQISRAQYEMRSKIPKMRQMGWGRGRYLPAIPKPVTGTWPAARARVLGELVVPSKNHLVTSGMTTCLANEPLYVRAGGVMQLPDSRNYSTGHVLLSRERLDQLLLAEITEFSMRPCRPLTLNQIARLKVSGALLARDSHDVHGDSAHLVTDADNASNDESFIAFLSNELPVRFASRIKQLETLPLYGTEVLLMQVRHIYVESFKQLRTISHMNREDFIKVVRNLKRRHATIVPLLVTGIRNLRQRFPNIFTDYFVDDFLDAFFLSRIGTEMLTSSFLSPKGVVDMECNPMEVIKRAAGDAEKLCSHHYGCCPRVLIWNFEEDSFACVPQYLYYILFELLKNAMRATVEHKPPNRIGLHSRGWRGAALHTGAVADYETSASIATDNKPPIQIVVSGDDDRIAIRVSDQGGGIGGGIHHIWSYMYTTARPVEVAQLAAPKVQPVPTMGSLDAAPVMHMTDNDTAVTSTSDGTLFVKRNVNGHTSSAGSTSCIVSPLAGFGCGLPLSRLYASYLGGTLNLMSLPFYGTDAYLSLLRIGDKQELMPCSPWTAGSVNASSGDDSNFRT